MYAQIKSVIREKGFTVNAVENALGFPRSTISKFDINAPSITRIQAIADFLGVSIDYLVGYKVDDIKLPLTVFDNICKACGTSASSEISTVGISRQEYMNWRAERYFPSRTQLYAIANTFNITLDNIKKLVEDYRNESVDEVALLYGDSKTLFSIYDKASPEKKKQILEIVKTISGE